MKYIIEIPDDVQYVLLNGQTDNKCYTAVRPIAELEELNSDYINEHYGSLQDEAYKRGYDDGYEAGCSTAFKPVSDADYQRGLNDAWGCMKSIAFLNKPRDMRDFFGHSTLGGVLNGYTPSEAIAKLKAYEDKQTDCIEVGDEVEWEGEKFTILRVFTPKGCYEQCDGFDDAGNGYTNILTKDVKKTGKHYDIQSILGAMKS